MSAYTSSIIFKYGDTDNVETDTRTISEIQSRQGSTLLIDIIAERAGTAANKFKMTAKERENLIVNLTSELETALRERL